MRVRLLAITPPTGDVDLEVVEAWQRAGALEVGFAVLLREPGARLPALVAPGHRLADLQRVCRREGVPMLASIDAVELPAARQRVEDGVLAGVQVRGDPSAAVLAQARRSLGTAVLGRSCHGAPAAGHEHVDYSCFAPVFAPNTSQANRPKSPAGLEALRRWTAEPGAFVIALGGVTPATAPACLAAGARGLAGISTFFGRPAAVAEDVGALVRLLRPPADAPPTP